MNLIRSNLIHGIVCVILMLTRFFHTSVLRSKTDFSRNTNMLTMNIMTVTSVRITRYYRIPLPTAKATENTKAVLPTVQAARI